MEDTATFSALPQEEQQELEQTLSQNSMHPSPTLLPGSRLGVVHPACRAALSGCMLLIIVALLFERPSPCQGRQSQESDDLLILAALEV